MKRTRPASAPTAPPAAPRRDRTEDLLLTFRADITPASIDVEARTVELVFSTGAPVTRYDWRTDSRYIERLSMDPEHVRLGRLNAGAPFLNAHSAWSLGDVLGVVVEGTAEVRGGKGRATVRFSKRSDVEPVWQDVRDGIVRNVSVGYLVHKFEQTDGKAGALPTRLAVDWEPYEISAVPIGADAAAQVRDGAIPEIVTPPAAAARKEPVMRNLLCRDCNVTVDVPEGASECPTCHGRNLVEPEAEPRLGQESEAARIAERERVQGILRGCEAARLPMSMANKLIADGTPLLEAQTRILDTLRTNAGDDRGPRPGPSGVRITGADPLENVWRGIAGALLHRISPQAFALDDNARQYRTHSLLRTMEECLEQRGIRTRGMSNSEIVKRALEYRSGLHGTSDFASLFADVSNKSLRAAYEAAPQTFEPITRRVGVRDFKPINRVQLGEAPNLEKVLEHGEFTTGTIAEGKEQYQLATFGRIFGMTRQGLINDDLDAFGRLITMFSQAARNKESDLVWATILANGLMGDSVALFDAAHGNVAGSAAAISVEALGIGRAAMRKQTGLDGRTYLNLMARFLVVPPEKETIADQFVTVVAPAQGSNVNPFAGRLAVISEPRLAGGVVLGATTVSGSATAWYLAASKDQAIDLIEYAFLEGEEGPQVETRAGFEIDGVQTKCRLDFAAKALDHRGLWKNAGA